MKLFIAGFSLLMDAAARKADFINAGYLNKKCTGSARAFS